MRRQILANCRRLIVKIGTRVLTRPDNTLDADRIAALVDGLVHWREAGRRVAVVSSGAVGAGIGLLGWTARPPDLARLQAVAAVGQTHLIQTYDRALSERGLHAAQVLLTAEDLNRRASYLNVRNTLLTLWELDIVPVINENDTVAVNELQTAFGDNDRLAGLVANLVGAPLIMLSDVDGLYDGDPRDPQSRVMPLVERWSESLESCVRDRATGVSKGGMASKLNAAKMVAKSGEFALIASGRADRVLQRILAGEELGTLFSPGAKPVTHRKRWIGFSAPARQPDAGQRGLSRHLRARSQSVGHRRRPSRTRFSQGRRAFLALPRGKRGGSRLIQLRLPGTARHSRETLRADRGTLGALPLRRSHPS